jgi:hypothetical protein
VTTDSDVVGTILGADTGVEGKLAPDVGGNEDLLSGVDMTEVILAETVVLVTSDITTSGLDTFVVKTVDESLTGVTIDGRELDTAVPGTDGETFRTDFCGGRIEETVRDKTSEVFTPDACISDEAEVADEETLCFMDWEEYCVTGVGKNTGGWGATLRVSFAVFCTVSLTPPNWPIFSCGETALECSGVKDDLLRSLNMSLLFCGETLDLFVVAWSSCLFFVVKVGTSPDSPARVLKENGLRESFAIVPEGNIVGSVLTLLLGVIVVLKVKVFDLGAVCVVPKDATLDGLTLSRAPLCA